MSKAIKPPLGLIPKYIWMEKRYIEVCQAIARYYNAGAKIPIEWIKEHNEIVEQANKSDNGEVFSKEDIIEFGNFVMSNTILYGTEGATGVGFAYLEKWKKQRNNES